jgi:serine-type D-Ala-D-Ala carboxypeptidase/endopeptidase (penicillin-binding protein 4)
MRADKTNGCSNFTAASPQLLDDDTTTERRRKVRLSAPVKTALLAVGFVASLFAFSLPLAPIAVAQDGGRVGVNPQTVVIESISPASTTSPTTVAPTTTSTTSTTSTTTTTVQLVVPVVTAVVAGSAVVTVPAVSVQPGTGSAITPGQTSMPAITIPSVTPSTVPGTPTNPTDTTIGTAGSSPTTVPGGANANPSTTTTTTTITKPGKTVPTTTVFRGATTAAELRAQVDAALAPIAGISTLITVDGVGAVAEREADVGRIPASTQKIYAGAASLLQIGPDATFLTEVRSSATPANGLLLGDLVVRASGDPSLSASGLTDLAAQVAKTGLKTVSGGLVVDETRYDSLRINPGWKTKFTPGEVGVLSAFSVDGNHRGSASLDPALANLVTFRAALKARGVTVVGGDRTGTLGNGGPVLASRTSAPLKELVAHALKKSDNTYAELLMKEIGARAGNGSTAGGIGAVRSQFDRFGIASPLMVDGSGLSSLNRSTARQQVQWLSKIRASTAGAAFRAALPIGCVDGTMKSRFCGTTAATKVVAKTGTLDFITALAGYTSTANGRVVTFSMIGNSLKSTSAARLAMDKALIAVTSATL